MHGVLLPYGGVRPRVGAEVFLAPGATVIGDVEIGAATNIWFGCTVRGDVNEVRIGARVNLQDGSVVHVTGGGHGTYIGDDVTIGHMALIHAATLEAGSFVGMKACVMDGVVVETGAMVAAGALVTPNKRVPAGELWGGSPAKKLRDLNQTERAELTSTVGRYCGLARQYREAGIGQVGDQ